MNIEVHSAIENFSQQDIGSFIRYGITADEIGKIVALGEALPSEQGRIGGSEKQLRIDRKIRETELSWIQHGEQSHWLFVKLLELASEVNKRHYRYDLTGFEEDALQYTVYHGSKKAPGMYDWHIDMHSRPGAVRKLSVVVSLSEPGEYSGGSLQLRKYSSNVVNASQLQGTVNIFPSWMLHRVSPVTKGTRRTLVGWLVGPHFR